MEAAQIAEMLRKKIADRLWSDVGLDRQVTASFGVAELHRSEFSLEAVIDRADQALYFAKVAGRNQVALASVLREKHFGSVGMRKTKLALPSRALSTAHR
jgi:PleD family two-component response regulator